MHRLVVAVAVLLGASPMAALAEEPATSVRPPETATEKVQDMVEDGPTVEVPGGSRVRLPESGVATPQDNWFTTERNAPSLSDETDPLKRPVPQGVEPPR